MKTCEESTSLVRQIRRENSAVVVELAGAIDLHRSIPLRACLLEVLAEQPPLTILNLAAVDFMDSSGLATLIEALQLSRRQQILLRLVHLQPRVRSIFEISRLDKIFAIYETEAAARELPPPGVTQLSD